MRGFDERYNTIMQGVQLNDRYAEVSDYELINDAFLPLDDSDEDDELMGANEFSPNEPTFPTQEAENAFYT